MPFYRGERITFDVAPSRLDFTVEHDSLRLEVKLRSALEAGIWDPSLGRKHGHINILPRMTLGGCGLCALAWGTLDIPLLTQCLHLAKLAGVWPVLLFQ